jgi:polyisoprenoid-binding protein YceI
MCGYKKITYNLNLNKHKKMKKVMMFLAGAMLVSSVSIAQVKKTNSATVTFDATTPTDEWPKATNNTVICAINVKSGQVEFKAKLENFSFKDDNKMIKEHWLDPKCMDGAKFPEAKFIGKLSDAKGLTVDGTYNLTVKGKLTIHGKSKAVSAPVTIVVSGGAIEATSTFDITSADFGVSHPAEGAGKVSKKPKLTITASLK